MILKTESNKSFPQIVLNIQGIINNGKLLEAIQHLIPSDVCQRKCQRTCEPHCRLTIFVPKIRNKKIFIITQKWSHGHDG